MKRWIVFKKFLSEENRKVLIGKLMDIRLAMEEHGNPEDYLRAIEQDKKPISYTPKNINRYLL